jgi:DNA-binding IclR family transcriptional regulator
MAGPSDLITNDDRVETAAGEPRIQSVARAARILEAIATSPDGLTAAEITDAVGVNRSTVYHLIQTLTSVGYVTAGPRRRYRLAIGLGVLVEGFERQVLPQDFLPLARSLAAATGETAYVAVRRGARLFLLCSVPGHHAVGVATSSPGPIVEGHARASGKLLLAHAPRQVLDEYLSTHPLVPVTSRTILDRDRLLAQLDEIARSGYATDEGEYLDGVSCLAVISKNPSTALVLSAPHDRFREHFDGYLAAAQQVATDPITI